MELKKLCGTLFVYNGIKQDYCFEEAIHSLRYVCDYCVILDAGSDDGTAEKLKQFEDDKSMVIYLTPDDWKSKQGREKLSYFTNICIRKAQELGYDYQFNLQADEVLHEDSKWDIREAISLGEEAYFVTRQNLWGDPYHKLCVPQSRKPVSTQIIRLTKTEYRSVDDAESVYAPASMDYINLINIFHMGFVRDKVKHLEKIRHIQDDVFLMDHDKRIDGMEKFDPWAFGFTEDDVSCIDTDLPIFVNKWAIERDIM